LAAGGAVDIREYRRGVYASRAAQRLSRRSAEQSIPSSHQRDVMDSPSATPDSPAAKLSPAQEQARLRRERRNAKIQAGGASRLQAITSLNGGHSTPAPSATKLELGH